MASLYDVCFELIHIVASFLEDKKDVGIFRLVCRKFNEIGACYAFRDIEFYLHEGDFEMLRIIADHPKYHKHVRSLTYAADILPLDRLSYAQFSRQVSRRRNRNSGVLEGMNDHEQLDGYGKYEQLFDWQIQCINTGLDYKVIEVVLPKFSNLQRVTVSIEDEFRTDDECRPLSSYRGGPFGPDLSPLFDHGSIIVREIPALSDSFVSDQYCTRPAHVVLSALKHCKDIDLKSLRIGVVNCTFLRQLHSHEQVGYLSRLFSNLTEFCLTVACPMGDDWEGSSQRIRRQECDDLVSTGVVRRMLRAMPKLSLLNLNFITDSQDDKSYHVPLPHVIEPGFVWERMDSFVLCHIKASPQELLDFISIHKNGTVDAFALLQLHDMELQNSSWLLFLPQLRSILNNREHHDNFNLVFSGDVIGENGDGEESWRLGRPDHECADDGCKCEDYHGLGHLIVEYLWGFIEDCPLADDNMEWSDF